jgi:hypothetical protein
MKSIIASLVLVSLFAVGETAQAGSYGQYNYSASRGYGYRTYTYYSQTYRSYRSHVAVYHPRSTRYVYYFNSHSRRYWGRYDLQTGMYQLLPENQRKESLNEIPENAFGQPGPMPGEEEGGEDLLPPPEKPAPMTQPRPSGSSYPNCPK